MGGIDFAKTGKGYWKASGSLITYWQKPNNCLETWI